MASNSLIKRIEELESQSLQQGGPVYYPKSSEKLLELMRTKEDFLFVIGEKKYTVSSFLDEVSKNNKGFVTDVQTKEKG